MSDSKQLFEAATRLIPGGVNSPVRAFKGVGGEPFFVARGEGARIWDVDGRSYLDFLGSWGPLILGHAPKVVVEAISEAARRGTSYGAPTALEVEMAEAITAAYPSIELVRLVSSGTEAAMSAIRVARGATGRLLLIKFDGCYHGHADSLLVKAGSGGATFSIPDSAGVPAPLAALTLTAPFNDLDAVRALFRARGDEIAGVIVEPVAGNMGVVAPLPGFLEGLREITHAHGALLIFDEVITGFRVAYGGAQALYGVRPDLTCLGKIIGGGLPVGAYGGARQLMGQVAPLGPVYQAGTLSGNPLAVAAGLATLRELGGPDVYATLDARGALLERGLREGARKARVPLTVNRVGSMLTAFFCDGPVTDYASAKRADTARYARYFHATRERQRLPGPRSSRSPTRRPTSSSRPGQSLTLSRRFRAEPAKTLTQYGVGDRLHKHHSIPRRANDCRWAHGRAWERWGLCSSPFWSFWRSRPGAGSRQSRSLRSSRSPSRIACTCRRTRWTASTATAMRGARNTPACRRSRAAWAATRSRARRCRR